MCNALLSAIQAKQAIAEKLSEDLSDSLLIEAIWPDAFEHGLVRFGGVTRQCKTKVAFQRDFGFLRAWFINGIGEKYMLTKDELMVFKPDALIHPDFNNSEVK